MARLLLFLLALLLTVTASAQAQRGRGTAAAQAQMRTEPATIECRSPLGDGVTTKVPYCDVLIGADPAEGIIVKLPPHTGDVTLTFDLHNRHTYSEELIKTNRAYRRYLASIGVLTLNNFLVSRAVILNEFRTPADLVDRISGGAGPGGVKAVAPTGTEAVRITIPAEHDVVSILGEKLSVTRPDGVDSFVVAGRPIAIISNVMVEYRPGPVRRQPAGRR